MYSRRAPSPLALVPLVVFGGLVVAAQDKVTYDDTPLLPGSAYRVHGERPWPAVIEPGAPTSQPPSDAIVLFAGADLSAWRGDGERDAGWRVADGAMEVNGTGSITTRAEFGDVQLHLEFATPATVQGSSQGRGNSGVFLMGRYEIQILDSFENRTYPDGQAAALYGQRPPNVNACRAPGEWQSYDILFETPRWTNGELTRPARATVLHNGVVVHHAIAFLGATAHGSVATYTEHGPTGPIQLQDHGNPVRFRNVWVRRLGQ